MRIHSNYNTGLQPANITRADSVAPLSNIDQKQQPVDQLIKTQTTTPSQQEGLTGKLLEQQRERSEDAWKDLNQFHEKNASLISSQDWQKLQQAYTKKDSLALLHTALKLKTDHPELQPKLSALAHQAAEEVCLKDFPKNFADGLMRTKVHYTPPLGMTQQLQQKGWELDSKTGLPLADAVIVGAGAGGLATSYRLASEGLRVATFEAGQSTQSFSDHFAKSVHTMRTDARATSLVSSDQPWLTLSHPDSLAQEDTLDRFSQLAKQGRQDHEAMTGIVAEHQPTSDTKLNSAVSRGELFAHFHDIADKVALDFPNSMLSEYSPVSSVTPEPDRPELFRVKTQNGHEILTKNLVLSTGLVGTKGEHANILPLYQQLQEQHPERFLLLGNTNSLNQNHNTLSEQINQLRETGTNEKHLVLGDQLLGNPSIREAVAHLPQGAHVSVVGSGESAIKSAIELTRLNQDIVVDLYTKSPLETTQVQFPAENIHGAILAQKSLDKDYQERSWNKMKSFGSPITPTSFEQLYNLQKEGRIQLIELGDYFSEKTMNITVPKDSGQPLQLSATGITARTTIFGNHQDNVERGLIDKGQKAPYENPSSMTIMAVGYNSSKAQQTPFVQDLVKNNLVSFDSERSRTPQMAKNSLATAANPHVFVCTAGAPVSVSDTSIPGLVSRARHISEEIKQDFPDRQPVNSLKLTESNTFSWNEMSQKQVEFIEQHRGLAALNSQTTNYLPLTDYYLSTLRRQWQENPGSLTPIQQLMLERSEELAARMIGFHS